MKKSLNNCGEITYPRSSTAIIYLDRRYLSIPFNVFKCFIQERRRGIYSKVIVSIIQNLAEIAEHLNSHFCSVGAVLDAKIPHNNKSPLFYMGHSCVMSFYASQTSVELIIKELNCESSFPKTIQSFIFQKCAQILSIVFSKLFNASIAEGQFPEILKVAWLY